MEEDKDKEMWWFWWKIWWTRRHDMCIKVKVRETRMHQRRKILVLCSHIWRRRGERSECINSSSKSSKTKRRKKKDDFKRRNDDVFYVINAFVLLRNLILFVQILLLLLRTLFLGSLSRVALFLFSPFHYTLKIISFLVKRQNQHSLFSSSSRCSAARTGYLDVDFWIDRLSIAKVTIT